MMRWVEACGKLDAQIIQENPLDEMAHMMRKIFPGALYTDRYMSKLLSRATLMILPKIRRHSLVWCGKHRSKLYPAGPEY